MKKFFGLFILAISLFVLSCSNFSNVGDNSTLGKIAIQLPASSKNARNVIVASAESTEYYVITLEGPSPTSVRDTGGSVVTFEELLPGEYTITVEAYSVEGYCISSASATAIVRAGETTSINLALPRNVLANTKFALWNYDNGSYNFKTFSSTPTSSNLIIQEDSEDFTAANNCTIEDNEGNVYYIFDGALYCRSVALCNFSSDYNINDVSFLYYDEKNDYIYGIGVYYDDVAAGNAGIIKLSGEDVRKKISNGQYSVPSTIYKLNGSGFNFATVDGGAVAITAFAIRGDDFYFVVKTIEPDKKKMAYHLYKATLTFSGSLANANCTKVLSVAPSENGNTAGISNIRGKITDITIASDGTAYALICDHSDFSIPKASSNGAALETPIYSRGAIAKITSDGNVSYLGYHDNVRNLTTNVGSYNIDWSDEPYYGSVKLYAPNKAQSSTEFYGPQKIIAKKPDELYIVDCGVNFMLAGFNPNNPAHNADSTGQEESGYHSGNAFIHNRIMKVDLKSFALGTVAEQVTVNSYNNHGSLGTNINDIFGCVALNNITPFANLLGYSGHFLCGPATVEDEI